MTDRMGKSRAMKKWLKKENKRRRKSGLPKLKITKLKVAKFEPSDLTGYLVPGVRHSPVCFEINTMAFPIRLEQQGVGRFRVIYGSQVSSDLAYTDAARKLGQAIMHAAACDGKLGNE